MKKEIRVLIVEDSEDDLILIKRELARSIHHISLEWVTTREDFSSRLQHEWWDAILSDYDLGLFSGIEIYDILKTSGKKIPFILISGAIGEETAVAAMRAGVNDYITKDNLARLGPALEREIEDDRIRREGLQTKKKLQDSEIEMESLFESVGPMCVIAPDYQFQKANNNFCSFFNMDQSTILSAKCYDVFRLPECRTDKCPLNQMSKQKRTVNFETEHQSSSGKHFNCLLSAVPLYNSKGKYVGVVESLTDITQIRSLENQLLQSQKMEALGRFAGGIAHDFNNILTVIMGFSQMIFSSLLDEDPIKEDIQEIIGAANRASALTGQILTFSRKHKNVLKSIDLVKLLKNFDKILQRLIGEDIELKTIFHVDTAILLADPTQIEQVLMNLATNARDAMPQGGELIIELKTIATSFLKMKPFLDLKRGTYFHLSITDTGVGIKKEHISHIFEPFYTTKAKGKGTGLGLSTVYGIVKQIEGDIEVESIETKGTTFHLYLPISQVDYKPSLPRIESFSNLYGREKILLVEDEQSVLNFSGNILRKFGYHVITAKNGVEALEVYRKNKNTIQLLFTDIVMPKKGGFELYQEIVEMNPRIKVLFMSGYSMNYTTLRHNKTEEKNFIQKPFNAKDLLQKIREILSAGNLIIA